MDVLADLHRANLKWQRDDARARQSLAERNALITQAVRDGKTHAEIGQALDVSRSRAGQLAQAALKLILSEGSGE